MWTSYSRVTISLPDVNVLIALTAEGHIHQAHIAVVPRDESIGLDELFSVLPRSVEQTSSMVPIGALAVESN